MGGVETIDTGTTGTAGLASHVESGIDVDGHAADDQVISGAPRARPQRLLPPLVAGPVGVRASGMRLLLSLLLALLVVGPAEARRPTRHQCVVACTARLTAECFADGVRFGPCKHGLIQSCRRWGVGICGPVTTTTTTLPHPGGIAFYVEGAYRIPGTTRVEMSVYLHGVDNVTVPIDPAHFHIGFAAAVVTGAAGECGGVLGTSADRDCHLYFDRPLGETTGLVVFASGGYTENDGASY